MPGDTDHRAQVEELLADYRRSRDQLASVHRSLGAISESASSQDGSVTATAGARGTLTGLTITDAAYRRYRPDELAALIVRVTGQASTLAMRRAGDVLADVVPSGTDPEALLLGTGDLRAEELATETPTEPAVEEGSFEDEGWLERAPRNAPTDADRRGPE